MIGPPSLPSCWIASFQPIRVLAKKIDSIARDDSFLIGCVPAGGVIPKIFATIKLPIRACSSAAPTAISRGKCFFSVPSSNGLPVCGFTTNWQIIACGTPKPTRILTLLRCSGVATKDFRPLRPGFPDIAPVPFFLTRIKCACPTLQVSGPPLLLPDCRGTGARGTAAPVQCRAEGCGAGGGNGAGSEYVGGRAPARATAGPGVQVAPPG